MLHRNGHTKTFYAVPLKKRIQLGQMGRKLSIQKNSFFHNSVSQYLNSIKVILKPARHIDLGPSQKLQFANKCNFAILKKIAKIIQFTRRDTAEKLIKTKPENRDSISLEFSHNKALR